jgi:hypothetical protein
MGYYTDDILGSSAPSDDDRRAAAHLIELDGCDGIQSAAALVGEIEAQSMLQEHIQRNTENSRAMTAAPRRPARHQKKAE